MTFDSPNIPPPSPRPTVQPPAPTRPPRRRAEEVQQEAAKAAREIARREGRASTILTGLDDSAIPQGQLARKSLLGGN